MLRETWMHNWHRLAGFNNHAIHNGKICNQKTSTNNLHKKKDRSSNQVRVNASVENLKQHCGRLLSSIYVRFTFLGEQLHEADQGQLIWKELKFIEKKY